MTTTMNRPNRYAATCIRCGGRIAAEEGLLARTDEGRWAADHEGECPEKPMVVASPQLKVNADGIYAHPDGTIFKVQIAKNGSGNLYAKRLHLTHGGGHTSGTFTYAPGAIHTLKPEWRMSTEQAAAFGALYGICACCGRDLTDEDSIARGIGPICARKYF